jgi:hypothetical protein
MFSKAYYQESSEETVLVLKSGFRSLPRLQDSLGKFESNHCWAFQSLIWLSKLSSNVLENDTYVNRKRAFCEYYATS